MTVQRTKWLILGVPGVILMTWMTLALQTRTINDNALRNAPKGSEWLTYGQSWSEQRHSTLTQITPANVNRLGLAWSYEIGEGGGKQEGTPLFSNGVIYGQTNWSITFAVDARTGKELWRYDPKADRTMNQPGRSRLCCGVISRGIALYEGKVIVPVVDGRIEAVDAATGRLLWSSLAIPEPDPDVISPYSITMAPRVAKGKVFIGNAGGEYPPFRGYVAAFDVNNGKELWRFYTVPGDPSKPFENKAMEAAAKTWTGEWWKMGGGGSIWDGMAYDPDENLLYVGTGNGLPWPQDLRQGKNTERLDNLYVASIIAIDADSGQLKWHYQCTPGDQWDYDAIQHLVLADIRINNRDRKVIMQANKNGYFYVIDRVTGEFISAGEMSLISWARGMDPKGRPLINPEAYYSSERGVTVHPVQMHNASQMSFSPQTGLIYVPINPGSSFNFTAAETFTPNPGAQNIGLRGRGAGGGTAPPLATPAPYGPVRKNPDGTEVRGGILTAWDPATQKERWFAMGGGNTDGGVVTTASNLVIQTTPNGHLMAYTADKGERLLDITLERTSGVGPPMTFLLDNKQYIAVMAGTGAAGGRGGGGRGGNRGGGAAVEPTAAAAQRGNAPAPPPAAQAPAQAPAPPAPGANNPRLFVYTLDAPTAGAR
ncbi:MAG TPA: PQQ-dependent dehydrogenase, methanol/ethanol family [Terriglobia bacterium]|nr:PQQ-dependent dehydrogenase, methanol/ethanol family [Terriglobia bacterium]